MGALYCSAYIYDCIFVYMKTMIDLDDEALELAARELGTTTKKDTVNAALEFVAGRRRRIEQLLDDPYAFGVGPDITDPDVMRAARR
jgi:Arc/MetJ family transcription regulator